jgi:hypothetical protein
MPSSGVYRRVALVRTEVWEERRMTIIGKLGATLAVTSYRSTLLVTANVAPSTPILVILMMEALRSSETSFLTRATRRNIPGYGILRCVIESRRAPDGG